jgi:proteasome accessory factor C
MSETSTERLARLLALVPWLRANDGITIEQAAEHFGVSADQLTTDLWQLIVCGIPGYGPDQLVDIQFWDDDRIHVIDAIALDRPLRLTGEEVAALHVALRVLAQVPGNPRSTSAGVRDGQTRRSRRPTGFDQCAGVDRPECSLGHRHRSQRPAVVAHRVRRCRR